MAAYSVRNSTVFFVYHYLLQLFQDKILLKSYINNSNVNKSN